MQYLVFLVLIWFPALVFAVDIYIPVPELPKVFNPAKAYDVFSINLNIQLHRRLFELDNRQLPIPDLIEGFSLSKDGLTYYFEVKKSELFHSGDLLNSTIVVDSLKNALKSGMTGIERFKCIGGFSDKKFSGIEAVSKLKFKIKMTCKDPRLIFHFSDVRLSIFNKKNPSDGLGAFKLVSKDNESIRLANRYDQSQFVIYILDDNQNKIDEIIRNKGSMILYMTSKMHSIYFNNENYLVKRPIQSLKNYNIHLNARTIPNKLLREHIFASIDREALVKKCYGHQNVGENFVPFGFLGHSKLAKLPKYSKNKFTKIKQMNIAIFSGVGNEQCVKAKLENDLSKNKVPVKVSIVSSSKGIIDFKENSVDGIFIYLEGEQNADMLEFYVDSPNLPLGNQANKKISILYKKMKSTNNQVEQFRLGEELRKEILMDSIVLPLFTPKEFVLHTKDLKLGSLGVYSPTFINLKNLKVVK